MTRTRAGAQERSVPGRAGVTSTACIDRPWAMAVTVWVGVAGPTSRAAQSLEENWLTVLAVGVVAAALLVVGARRPWWLRAAAVLLAAVIVAVVAGEVTAAWMAAGLVTGSWVSTGVPPAPWLPPPAPGSTGPVLLLGAVAMWQGSAPTSTWQLALPVVAAAALPLIGHWRGGAVHRGVDRFARSVTTAVSVALFAGLSLLLVLAPWSLRLIGHDPLRHSPGWASRSSAPAVPARPWAHDRVAPAPQRGTRIAGLLVVAALAVGGAVVWYRAVDDPPVTRDALLDTDWPAAGQEQWFPAYLEDVRWALDERVAFRPFEVYRLRDVQTRHVNVASGVRRSWRTPGCDCPVVTLWLYGGGAAFGLGQRDEHTIASALARRAAEDGIDLEVLNRGVPGQLHWRNAFRFSYDLTYGDAPDVVVFYDGADEVDGALAMEARGLGDTRAPFEPTSEDAYDELIADSPELPRTPRSPMARVLGWPVASDADPEDAGALAVLRYERHRQLSAATAEAAEVRAHYFWQPTWYGRDEQGDRPAPGSQRRRDAFDQAAGLLAPDVTDLSDALAELPGVVFLSESTHGERGAAVIADAMYRSLRGDLLEAAEAAS